MAFNRNNVNRKSAILLFGGGTKTGFASRKTAFSG